MLCKGKDYITTIQPIHKRLFLLKTMQLHATMVTFALHSHKNNLAFFAIHNELFNFVSKFRYIAEPTKNNLLF